MHGVYTHYGKVSHLQKKDGGECFFKNNLQGEALENKTIGKKRMKTAQKVCTNLSLWSDTLNWPDKSISIYWIRKPQNIIRLNDG